MADRFIDRVNRIAREQRISVAEAIRVARVSERMDREKAKREAQRRW